MEAQRSNTSFLDLPANILECVLRILDTVALVTVSSTCRQLREIGSQVLSSATTITLDLPLLPNDVERILQRNTCYTSLTFDGARIKRGQLPQIASPRLQSLTVMNSAHLASEVMYQLRIATALRTLTLHALDDGSKKLIGSTGLFLAHCTNLEELRLDAGFVMLSFVGSYLRTAMQCRLSALALGSFHTPSFFRGVRRGSEGPGSSAASIYHLRQLVVAEIHISDWLMAQICRNLTALELLDLTDKAEEAPYFKDLTDAGLQILCHTPSLTSLALTRAHPGSFSRITDFGLMLLPGCCPALRELSLSGCTHVTDAGAADLASRLPLLTRLCLPGTRGLTDLFFYGLGSGSNQHSIGGPASGHVTGNLGAGLHPEGTFAEPDVVGLGEPPNGLSGEPQKGLRGEPQNGLTGEPQKGLTGGEPQKGLAVEPQSGPTGESQKGLMGEPQSGLQEEESSGRGRLGRGPGSPEGHRQGSLRVEGSWPRNLQALNVSRCGGVTGVALTGLTWLTGLRELKLNGCRDVGDEAVPAFVELPRLETLCLNQTGITDEGVALLAKADRLVSLSLGYCTLVEGHGVEAMLWGMGRGGEGAGTQGHGGALHRLDLSGTRVSSEGLARSLLLSEVALTELRLRECNNIAGSFLSALAHGSPNFEGLHNDASPMGTRTCIAHAHASPDNVHPGQTNAARPPNFEGCHNDAAPTHTLAPIAHGHPSPALDHPRVHPGEANTALPTASLCLRELDLRGCSRLTPADTQWFLKPFFPRLRCLRLDSNLAVQSWSSRLSSLEEARPFLRIDRL